MNDSNTAISITTTPATTAPKSPVPTTSASPTASSPGRRRPSISASFSSSRHRRHSSSEYSYVHVVGGARRLSHGSFGHHTVPSPLISASRQATFGSTGRRPSEIMAGIGSSSITGAPIGSSGGHAWIDWEKNARSKNYRGSGSFATFMIIGPTCFFLGILFAMFPYDFPLLWTSAPVPPEYYDQLEMHLKFMHSAPPLIARVLNIMVSVGFLGFFIKLFRPSESNVLFDGASLVLYVMSVGIYITNIAKGLRAASAGVWHTEDFQGGTAAATTGGVLSHAAAMKIMREGVEGGGFLARDEEGMVLDREDCLRVLAASNTILALVLIGVLVLQSGQWYAERKELEELERMDEMEAERGQKKRQ